MDLWLLWSLSVFVVFMVMEGLVVAMECFRGFHGDVWTGGCHGDCVSAGRLLLGSRECFMTRFRA